MVFIATKDHAEEVNACRFPAETGAPAPGARVRVDTSLRFGTGPDDIEIA